MQKRRERIDRGIKVRSGDVFALCSWREMLYLAGPRVLPVVAILMLPLVLGIYWQKVLLSVAVFALLMNLLMIMGALAFAQAQLSLPGIAGGILTVDNREVHRLII